MEVHRCSKEGELAEIKADLRSVAERIVKHDVLMDKMEIRLDAQYKMSEAVAVMAQQMGGMREDVKEMKVEVSEVKKDVGSLKIKMNQDRVKELEDGVGIWNKFKWLIVTSIVSLLTGYIISTMLGGGI